MTGGGWLEFAAAANAAFLLGFPMLFSIINPIGAALIFYGITKDFSRADRVKVAGRVAFYSLLIMLGALWGGAYVLNFFGVSLDALRLAGGTVVAVSGWRLLTAGDEPADPKKDERRVAAEDRMRDPLQLAFSR
jgi:multiple antibiotic resistance protein